MENLNLIKKDGSAKIGKMQKKKDGDSSAVNLVASSVSQQTARSTVHRNAALLWHTFVVSVACVLLGTIGLTLYGLYLQRQLTGVTSTLAQTNAEIKTLEKDAGDLIAFQNRLGKIRTLLDGHVYWTQFLDALEKVTLPAVSYDNLSVSTQGSAMMLSASAPDYATVAQQLKAFQEAKHLASSASISGATAQVNQQGDTIGVKFSISFTLNPGVLKKK